MVIEALIVTAVASAMLGWNVHVICKSGACCPPEGSAVEEAPARQRSLPRTNSLRRRRRSSRRKVKEQQDTSGTVASKRESKAENQRAPSTAGVMGTVNGERGEET